MRFASESPAPAVGLPVGRNGRGHGLQTDADRTLAVSFPSGVSCRNGRGRSHERVLSRAAQSGELQGCWAPAETQERQTLPCLLKLATMTNVKPSLTVRFVPVSVR
eukprot:gene5345-biopygen22223